MAPQRPFPRVIAERQVVAFVPCPMMPLEAGIVAPIVALVAGILILVVPRALNYIVAFYLIVVGLAGLAAQL